MRSDFVVDVRIYINDKDRFWTEITYLDKGGQRVKTEIPTHMEKTMTHPNLNYHLDMVSQKAKSWLEERGG